MRALIPFLAGVALLAAWLTSCSRERLTIDEEGDTFDLEQAAEDMEAQIEYYDVLETLAAQIDTTAALDSLLVLLYQDPEVLWASNVNTGVNVQWRSGLRGMITIRTLARQLHAGAPIRKETPNDAPQAPGFAALSQDIYTIPEHRKSLFLAPCYSEFRLHDN
ncbi:MAG: hypothetical protein GF355_03400, partial [Candidatus Eisenbacteria bacterium]|nr:hypothetical protein [Candidatus Eisenbacteria bacterium]